jgi:hypothetical protein
MKIGIFGRQWWTHAATTAGHYPIELRLPLPPPADKHHADVAARLAAGAQSLQAIRAETSGIDFLLDDAGTGLQFVSEAGVEIPVSGNAPRLLHEAAGMPLVSHFIDPVPTALQAVPPVMRYQALQSRSWIKLVFDKAHAYELKNFGVPNVVHMPIGAVDQEYDTQPLDPKRFTSAISFVGSQVGTYFYPGRGPGYPAPRPPRNPQGVRPPQPGTVV